MHLSAISESRHSCLARVCQITRLRINGIDANDPIVDRHCSSERRRVCATASRHDLEGSEISAICSDKTANARIVCLDVSMYN